MREGKDTKGEGQEGGGAKRGDLVMKDAAKPKGN